MNYDKSVSIYMYYLCYEDNLGRKQSWQQLKVTAMQVSEQENITCKKKTDKNEGSRSAGDQNAKIQTGLNMQRETIELYKE